MSKFLKENRLLQNFVTVGLLQSANLVVPLLLTPYFIFVFGLERFGIVALCQTVMLYLTLVVEYDFGLIAVKDLSINRDDRRFVQSLFSRVFYTRIVLALLCLPLLLLITAIYPLLRAAADVALLSYAMLVGQMVLSNWFYQGMEEMRLMALVNIAGKALYVGTVFLLVREPSDYLLPNFLLGASNTVVGIVGLAILSRKYRLQFTAPGLKAVVQEIVRGKRVFFSNVSVAIYANSNTLLLGLLGSPLILGYYSVVERVIAACRSLLSVFFQVSFPRISHLSVADPGAVVRLINNFYRPFTFLVALLCGAIALFASQIIAYFLSNPNEVAVQALQLAAVIPLIVFLNIPYFQLLIINNHAKAYTNTLVAAGAAMVVLASVMIPLLGVAGAVLALIITECAVTLALYHFAKNKYRLL